MANAAVMGLIPPVRYVLLSDSLIEGMPDQQIEAVFGHEAGHVKHHHIAYLVMFVLGSGSLVLLFMEIGLQSFDMLSDSGFRLAHMGRWLAYPWSAALVIGWFVLFGWVSRRFEQTGRCARGRSNQLRYRNDRFCDHRGGAWILQRLSRRPQL